MNIVTKLLNRFIAKDYSANQEWAWWHDVGMPTIYHEYKNEDYENAYSSISKITQGFASIEPYAVNEKGDRIVKHNVIDNIYNPNKQMSAYDFREALMLMFLVWDEYYLRVHYAGERAEGEKINYKKINGFTFLENVTPQIIGGKKTFYYLGRNLTDEEVLTIHSTNPYRLTTGYSNSRAARRWARLDDYIADYQAGFFRNGAVPSGQFIITAKTKAEFNDIVDLMQRRHKGAGKNNNVTYTHRPLDGNDRPVNAQIEWVPFNTQNKDMALRELLEAVNQKIDSAYGVPGEIRGHLQNSNYASVRMAEKIFIDYTLRPLTFKIWDKFTSELARVTGGFDAAISFDLPSPSIADEEKVRADARKVEVETIQVLTSAGYELESIVQALSLDKSYLKLKEKPQPYDNPDVVTPGDMSDKPTQPIDATPIYKNIKVKQLTETQRDEYQDRLSDVIRKQLTSQVNGVIETLDEKTDPDSIHSDDKTDELFSLDMLQVLLPLVYAYGKIEQSRVAGQILALQKKVKKDLGLMQFTINADQQKSYQKYLQMIARDFDEQTAEKIRNVLLTSQVQGLPVAEIKTNLSHLIDEEYRIRRLAVTEVNRAQNHAGLFAVQNIQRTSGYQIKKIARTSAPDPCPLCEELDGTEVGVEENFWNEGDTVIGTDGKEYVNNFVDADTADFHANCRCVIEYVVEGFEEPITTIDDVEPVDPEEVERERLELIGANT